MTVEPRQLTLEEWDARYASLARDGIDQPPYGGPLGRHVDDGDLRLRSLRFDDSLAALNLWNLLLTEEERLREARDEGYTLIGTMKDLGTVPVMAFSLPRTVAFYPDGAWWLPCVMELSAGLLRVADSLGVDESFCPVRAMLGAFVTEDHFPIPDLLTCSVGAVCDDFSAIAQRVEALGHPIVWWEMPHRRSPEPGEEEILLPGGFCAPRGQVDTVRDELDRVRQALEAATGGCLDRTTLEEGIRDANAVRDALRCLRETVFSARRCPLPPLELLIAEMLAIHYCSDRNATLDVLRDLNREVARRVDAGVGYLEQDAVRVFWVNPVADLKVMHLLEDCGGRLCGTEYLFSHALDPIPTGLDPMEALARTALADPMVGSSADRARRILDDARRFGAEAVLISDIPGASHCAHEGRLIAEQVEREAGLPVVEIEVPPLSDTVTSTLKTRLEALMEVARGRR